MEREAGLTTAVLLLPYPWMKPQRQARCWRCGQHTPLGCNYCAVCGAPMRPELAWYVSTRVCRRCEKTIPLLSRYCPECGEKR